MVSSMHMSGSYIILGASRDGMFYTPEMSSSGVYDDDRAPTDTMATLVHPWLIDARAVAAAF